MIPDSNSYGSESTIKYLDQILDTSSGYSGSDTASNSDISSPDSLSTNGSFDFTPQSEDLEHSDIAQDDFSNISNTIFTNPLNETFTATHSTTSYEWDTEWDDSDDDTSSIYTSQSEYSDSDSEYPNSDSEYDLSSGQGINSETYTNDVMGNPAAEMSDNASVIIDVSNELQVSEVQANILDESEILESADQPQHLTGDS